MATVTKDFKVKNGLIVEGTTGTINNHDILTKKTDDQNYIVNLIGGTATSANEANKVVKRDGSGNFAAGVVTADLVGNVTGNADTATALETARTISLTGDATGSVSFDGTANAQITVTLDSSFATDAEVATAKGEAISTASSDATSKANAAKSGAEATAAAALASAVSDLEDYADQAEADANTFTTNAITALNLAGTYDALGSAAQALSDANDYTDDKVADLVNSAPALLDTLSELAAAIANNPSYATDVANLVATKADTSYVNSEISDLDTAAQGYASTAQSNAQSFATNADSALYTTVTGDIATAKSQAESTAQGYANTAQSNAEDYADGLNATTNTRIDNLDTDDVAEGTNQYFTSNRAKIAAAQLITSATKTNIQITGDENGLTITAENGVADSTTSDLAEGSNLYFTNARAVSALEAVTPDFPAVEIASVAKQVASQATVTTASTNTAVSWAKADYRSAEFLVKIANGTHTEVSKVILTLDTSDNIAVTEYAMVGTNGSLGSVSADVSGADVRLRVTTDNNNSTVAVVGTLLK
jgi:vacuolar-type H+-ATPase subunit E/Vma4